MIRKGEVGTKAETYGDFKIYFPIFGEAKIDGRRCLIIIRDLKARAISGSGKDLTDRLPAICSDLTMLLELNGLHNGVFDGEINVELEKGDKYKSCWSNTGMAFSKHIPVEKINEKIRFAAFDFLSLDIFDKTEYFEDITPLKRRDIMLRKLFTCNISKHIFYIEKKLLHTQEEIDTYYQQLRNFGWEGIMLKDPDMSYKNYQRTAAWLKRKPVKTEDFPIVGFECGKGKNSKRLGAIVVQTPDGELRVGGGLKDKPDPKTRFRNLQGIQEEFECLDIGLLNDRETIWKFRHFLMGQIIEVKSQDDKEKVCSTARSPRFVRFRPDKV